MPTPTHVRAPFALVVSVPGGYVFGHDLSQNRVTITGDRSQAMTFGVVEDALDFIYYWDQVKDAGISYETASLEFFLKN